jgi:hypothetical protein
MDAFCTRPAALPGEAGGAHEHCLMKEKLVDFVQVR